MQLRFLGGADTLSGAAHLIEFEGFHILLDAGMQKGLRPERQQRKERLGIDPENVHSVVLTNARLGRCGNLPRLSAGGFGGTVFATSATQDLAGAVLRDFGFMHQQDVEMIHRLQYGEGDPPEPLYTIDLAEQALYHINGLHYHRTFHILRELRCTFMDAGHMLGSAVAVLDAAPDEGEKCRIVYTGDLGRVGTPVLRNPEVPDETDVLIVEATCGDVSHPDPEAGAARLIELVAETLKAGGKILVPGFSIGPAQHIIATLQAAWKDGRLPETPLYVDSPLAVDMAEVFRHHSACYDNDVRTRFLTEEDPFGFGRLIYVRAPRQSQRICEDEGPAIVFSPTSSCDTGRIRPHLRTVLEDDKNLVLLTEPRDEGTLAHRLAEGGGEVEILNETVAVKARVEAIEGFSGHADREELINYVRLVAESGSLRHLFITHGTNEARRSLAQGIQEAVGLTPILPDNGEGYEI